VHVRGHEIIHSEPPAEKPLLPNKVIGTKIEKKGTALLTKKMVAEHVTGLDVRAAPERKSRMRLF
jgi:hypothetical protein